MMSDALLAQSAVDRLTSGAHTLVVEGPSYRQRHSTGVPALTTREANSDAHSQLQVVPCSWQPGGPITLASDTSAAVCAGRLDHPAVAPSLRLSTVAMAGHLRASVAVPLSSPRSSRTRRQHGAPTIAKPYRLLLASDPLNRGRRRAHPAEPCRIKAPRADASAERPVLSVEKVFAVAAAMPERYRRLVLLATFTSLRFGELSGRQGAPQAPQDWRRYAHSRPPGSHPR